LAGPITDAEFGAASIAAIGAAQRGEGRKKIKRRGRRAIQLKRKAQPDFSLLRLAQQLRQLGDIEGDPPRFVARHRHAPGHFGRDQDARGGAPYWPVGGGP
jgi:hypothetical protein